ncbi:MAG: sporulation transcriptional regulator SpoIIID [Oscillospiraceae bacterium]|nr:sporulation transcriptional regulator SpoIIID [Oscillospiraceae bacterium]
MTDDKDERARRLAVYMIESGGTVRSAADHFGISKSTVHKDLCDLLPRASPALYARVRELMDKNKSERHIRGGMATKQKYKKMR